MKYCMLYDKVPSANIYAILSHPVTGKSFEIISSKLSNDRSGHKRNCIYFYDCIFQEQARLNSKELSGTLSTIQIKHGIDWRKNNF